MSAQAVYSQEDVKDLRRLTQLILSLFNAEFNTLSEQQVFGDIGTGAVLGIGSTEMELLNDYARDYGIMKAQTLFLGAGCKSYQATAAAINEANSGSLVTFNCLVFDIVTSHSFTLGLEKLAETVNNLLADPRHKFEFVYVQDRHKPYVIPVFSSPAFSTTTLLPSFEVSRYPERICNTYTDSLQDFLQAVTPRDLSKIKNLAASDF